MFQLGMTGLLGSLGAVSKVVLLLLFVFSVVSWAIIFLKWRAFATADRMDQQFMGLLAKAKDLDDLCRQVRRMVIIEAALIGAVSQGIGLAVGFGLSMVLIYVINVQSFGWTIQFHVPLAFLIQASIAVVLATSIAGIYPARRAAQLVLSHDE